MKVMDGKIRLTFKEYLISNRKSGYITVLFCVLSIFLAWGLYYNIYTASSVQKTIHLQNSVDTATYAMGVRAAQGLNYIGVNNISIASALHITASIPLIAAYLTIAKAITESAVLKTANKLFHTAVKMITPKKFDSSIGQDIWMKFKPVAEYFMKIAESSSTFNNELVQGWFTYCLFEANSLFKEMESDKKLLLVQRQVSKKPFYYMMDTFKIHTTKEGILAMGIQDMDFTQVPDAFNMKLKGVIKSQPDRTLKFTLRASDNIIGGARDAPLYWLSSVIPSKTIGELNETFNKIFDMIPDKLKLGFKGEGIQLPLGGGWVSHLVRQFKYFSKQSGVEPLGFTVVDNINEFINSISFMGASLSSNVKASTGLSYDIVHPFLAVNSFVRLVNNELTDEGCLFYPSWYPIMVDTLTR